ncbi:MAG: preprotein translocase subunit SecG [Oscillospiraceae bacterium]
MLNILIKINGKENDKMGVPQIIAGVILIIASVLITLLVLAQESKDQGLSSAIGGGANDSFYEKNMSRTRDAKLSKLTKILGIVLVVVTLVVDVLIVLKK